MFKGYIIKIKPKVPKNKLDDIMFNDTEHYSKLLAGKLAIAARNVLKANPRNLSHYIMKMETALDNYDKHVFSLIDKDNHDPTSIV